MRMRPGKLTSQVENLSLFPFSCLLPALNQRCDGEIEARETEDRIINERIDKEISDREQA